VPARLAVGDPAGGGDVARRWWRGQQEAPLALNSRVLAVAERLSRRRERAGLSGRYGRARSGRRHGRGGHRAAPARTRRAGQCGQAAAASMSWGARRPAGGRAEAAGRGRRRRLAPSNSPPARTGALTLATPGSALGTLSAQPQLAHGGQLGGAVGREVGGLRRPGEQDLAADPASRGSITAPTGYAVAQAGAGVAGGDAQARSPDRTYMLHALARRLVEPGQDRPGQGWPGRARGRPGRPARSAAGRAGTRPWRRGRRGGGLPGRRAACRRSAGAARWPGRASAGCGAVGQQVEQPDRPVQHADTGDAVAAGLVLS